MSFSSLYSLPSKQARNGVVALQEGGGGGGGGGPGASADSSSVSNMFLDKEPLSDVFFRLSHGKLIKNSFFFAQVKLSLRHFIIHSSKGKHPKPKRRPH